MTVRRWFIAIAIASGALAGLLYYGETQRAAIVAAARDVEVPRALVREDLELREISADFVPRDAVTSVDDALGLVPRVPLLRGQILIARGLASELTDLRSGMALAVSQRAIAVPVSAVNAVGGAVVPGSRVDVLSVPVLGRAPAGRMVELLASGALVLDVRGESGAPFMVRDPKASLSADRIASVVIAIATGDELRFADRIATSTFVLLLSASR
jgi:Flp pilus assembly protein CpaB